MATRKVKPNIAGMMQNASDNVQPRPHHPTPEEIHEELTETLSPTPAQSMTVTEPKKGRPFAGRTLQTRGGKQVAFDKDDDEALYMASYRTGHSQKDIIRTAVHDFLKRHYDGTTLDATAQQLIDDYVKSTSI